MASEFYEQLGVDRTASSAKIRTAYGQHVVRLARRRKALIEQGGDTLQLDLQRAHLDEAWEVLSDPLRRRRYDVMLRWADRTLQGQTDLPWEEVSDGLVHPAAAVAAKLLRVTSRLSEIGLLPLAPSGSPDEPPTLVPHEDDLTTPRSIRLSPLPTERKGIDTAELIALPEPAPQVSLRVVDGSPGASDVLVLPGHSPPLAALPSLPPSLVSNPPAHSQTLPSALPSDEIGMLVDQYGYSGALLQEVRLRMGLTLQDLSDHTRISVRYLEALESESRDSLPSATFVRGYVREVSRLLKLPVDSLVAGYLRRMDT